MKVSEVKALIKCLHGIYYQEEPNILNSPTLYIKYHQHLSKLFDYAGITETLCKNNPEGIHPNDLMKYEVEHDNEQIAARVASEQK